MNLQIRHEELLYYRWMRTARCIDDVERELVARGEAFFQVSAAGHEASAMLAPHLSPHHYLHCHYRDKALMVARGIPISAFFDSLVCNVASHSAGRQMSAHLSAPHHRVLSIVGPLETTRCRLRARHAMLSHRASWTRSPRKTERLCRLLVSQRGARMPHSRWALRFQRRSTTGSAARIYLIDELTIR